MSFSTGQVLTAAQLNDLDIDTLQLGESPAVSKTPDSSWSGFLNISMGASSDYTGGIAGDDDGMWIGHNSSARDIYFAINESKAAGVTDGKYLVTFGNTQDGFRSTTSSGRNIMELRSGASVGGTLSTSTGAAYNLYGSGDSTHANKHIWFTGTGSTRMALSSSGLTIIGSLSKSSGSFDIPHPTKGGDWRLRHSFIEGPTCDNIYRGTVTLTSGSATIDLDTVSNMTAGTFEALNKNLWSMVSSSGNAVTWSLSGKTLTINGPADAECCWIVIGERKDQSIIDSDMTNDDGELIVEYERADIVETVDGPEEESDGD